MREIPDGDLTGLSLSFCVKDIIDDHVPLDRVVLITAGTMAVDEKDWEHLIDTYCRTYWRKDPERARKVVRYLRLNSMIDQPRTRGREPPSLECGHWRLAR